MLGATEFSQMREHALHDDPSLDVELDASADRAFCR